MNIQDVSLLKIEDDGTNCDDTLVHLTLTLGEIRAIQKFVIDAQSSNSAETDVIDENDGSAFVDKGQMWERISGGVNGLTPNGYFITVIKVDGERAYWSFDGATSSLVLRTFVKEFSLVSF